LFGPTSKLTKRQVYFEKIMDLRWRWCACWISPFPLATKCFIDPDKKPDQSFI